LQGGSKGPTCKTRIQRKGQPEIELPSKGVFELNPGDVVKIWTTGSGGYGDPKNREPERVLDDVLNGRVSVQKALEDYGVVIISGQVDHKATATLRQL